MSGAVTARRPPSGGPDDLVALDLERAAHLATALATAADELAAHVPALHHLLVSAGADLHAVRVVAEVGAWCEREHRRLAEVIEAVRSWPPTAPGRSILVQRGSHPSFAEVGEARAAARASLEARRAGNHDRFVAFARAWQDDPVFSAAVLRSLGPTGMLAALASLSSRWTLDGDESRGTDERREVDALAGLFATATRYGVEPFGVAALVEAAGDDAFRLAAIGLLTIDRVDFDTDSLRSFVDDYVLVINRRIQAGTLASREVRLGVVDGAGDPRALVFDAVAAHPGAAREALGDPAGDRLDLLLSERNGYADEGRALGSLLLAGTAPLGPGPPSPAALGALIWIARRADLPPAAHAVAGRMAAPYIGSFRPHHLEGVTADPLASLREPDAVAYLHYAARHPKAADDLRDAAAAWAARQFDQQAARRDGGRGYHEIGGLLGVVDLAHHAGRRARAQADDAGDEATHGRIELVIDGAVGLLTVSAPLAGGLAAAGAAQWASGQVIAAPSSELHLLRDLPRVRSLEQVAAQLWTMAVLWQHRHENLLFDLDGTRPTAAPPPVALLGAGPITSEEVLRRFLAWKEQPAVNDSMLGRHLDDLAASYGEAALAGS